MRIPFDDPSRPKAVSKQLATLSTGLRLSVAQEAVVKACGYRDWHDFIGSTSRGPVAYQASTDQDAAVVARLADALNLADSDVQHIVAKAKLVDGESWPLARHQACSERLRRERGRLTAAQIARGKTFAVHRSDPPYHEHDDCIRMAYEWLDAQA